MQEWAHVARGMCVHVMHCLCICIQLCQSLPDMPSQSLPVHAQVSGSVCNCHTQLHKHASPCTLTGHAVRLGEISQVAPG